MAKKSDDARTQGFKRGLGGKAQAAGVLEGWTDDKESGIARNEGYVAGGRERLRKAAKKRADDKK